MKTVLLVGLGIVVLVTISSIVIIIALRKRNSQSPNIGCFPQCGDWQICQNNTCINRKGYCKTDRDCPTNTHCLNPGTPGSECINCTSNKDCTWNPNTLVCINPDTPQSECVQCDGAADCQDLNKYVCINNKCIVGCEPELPISGNYLISTMYNGLSQYLTLGTNNDFVITPDKSQASVVTWTCGGNSSNQGTLSTSHPAGPDTNIGLYSDSGPSEPQLGASSTLWQLTKLPNGNFQIQPTSAQPGNMYCWYYCKSGGGLICGDRIMCNSSCDFSGLPYITGEWVFESVNT